VHRDERRAELLQAIPGWYSGVAHAVLVCVSGLAVIGACLLLVERFAPWHAGLALGGLVFANLFEWWVHRGPLHERWRGLGLLYERHSRAHHVAFLDDDMAIRSARELRLVLFPPFVFPLFVLLNAPLLLLLAWLGGRDAGLVFMASAVTYYLIYEGLHTLHHLPGRRRGVTGWMQRHHARHHDPTRMREGNWNVSFPLWDVVLRTTLEPQRSPSGELPRSEFPSG
jgi:hypothetical protein